jgi:hypothetical protein
MRRPVDEKRVRDFLHALALSSEQEARVYLTGGATAVLYGWRPTTIDLDYPAIDPKSFRRALEAFLAADSQG